MITVRPWTRRDRRAMERWPAHPEPVRSLWNIHRPVSGERISYAVEVEGATVGRISATLPGDGECWIGIWLEPGSCGRGIGTEALRRAVAELFSQGVRALRLALAVSNRPAARCYEKLGFAPISYEWRQGHDGATELYVLMRLAVEEWNHAPVRVAVVGSGAGAGRG